LYVLYKATAAVKLAALLESRRGRPVVPVFWSASEDHDFAEVRSVPVLDESGRIRTLRYEPAREPAGQPASRIVLDETIAGLAGRGVEFVRYEGMDQDPACVWTAPGGAQVAWFRDPDGNVLSLTQLPP